MKSVVKRKHKPSGLRNNFHNPRESKTNSPGQESKRPPYAAENSRSQIESEITKSLSCASASSTGPSAADVAPSEMPPMRAAIRRDATLEHSGCDGVSKFIVLTSGSGGRATAQGDAAAGASGSGRRRHLAMTEDCFVRPQTDANDFRSLIRLRAVRRILILTGHGCFTAHAWAPQEPQPLPLPQPELGCKIGSVAAEGMGVQEPTSTSPLRMRSADCNNFSCALPPAQHSHSPCAGISAPRAMARRCATSHKNSTGDSASPFSNSPFAGHMPQRFLMRQASHLLWRVFFVLRTRPRKSSQPAMKLPERQS